MKKFFKNLFYSLSGNLFGMLSSMLVLVVLPKFLSISDYGYWQLYMFYLVYTGYLSFGISEGAFVRYSGEDYSLLPKASVKFQYLFLLISNLLIGLIFVFICYSNDLNFERFLTYIAVVISTILITPRYFLCNVLQATNHFKENTIIVVIEKIVFMLFLSLLVFSKQLTYENIIFGDLIAKMLSTLFLFYKMSDFLWVKLTDVRHYYSELKENFILGIKLVLSNVSSLLIIGLPRLFIERFWGVVVFSQVSLIISFTNLIITLVNAVGFVLLPSLVKVKDIVLMELYPRVSKLTSVILSLTLLFYYPIIFFIGEWLPAYKGSIPYMIYIFPIIIFESKMALLYNTYLKIFREENFLVKVNIFSVILVLASSLCIIALKDSLLLIGLLPIIYIIRTIIIENKIMKLFSQNYKLYNQIDIILAIVFVVINVLFDYWGAFILQNLAWGIIMYLSRKDLKFVLQSFRS